MKTSLKIFVLSIVLVGGIFLIQNLANLQKIGQPPIEDDSRNEESQKVQVGITVNLKFDFGNGNIKAFDNIKLEEGKTVFDLLKKVTQENNLEFSFKEYPGLGVFVESIDGISNDAKINKWWQYWVNGEYAQAGASIYKFKNSDLIEWKYVKNQS